MVYLNFTYKSLIIRHFFGRKYGIAPPGPRPQTKFLATSLNSSNGGFTERATESQSCNRLDQCFPKTGPRTICGPPKSLNWSVEIFLGPKHVIFDLIWLSVEQNCPKKGPPSNFMVRRKKIASIMVRDSKKFGKQWARLISIPYVLTYKPTRV